jgi:hypothetical protein
MYTLLSHLLMNDAAANLIFFLLSSVNVTVVFSYIFTFWEFFL